MERREPGKVKRDDSRTLSLLAPGPGAEFRARHCEPGGPSAQRLTSTHTRTPASRAITAQGTHHAANQARNPATVPVFYFE